MKLQTYATFDRFMVKMKDLSDLLLLGDARLYEKCAPVRKEELPLVPGWVADLHQVMEAVRARYGFGRGIAAPQLGIMKRLFYLNIDRPIVAINPQLADLSEEMFELWDDCMCFPDLFVRVKRHKSLTLHYLDERWEQQTLLAKDDLSELIQHEYDHLEGILCTMRANDERAFKWRGMS
jgi:peptide deformylase